MSNANFAPGHSPNNARVSGPHDKGAGKTGVLKRQLTQAQTIALFRYLEANVTDPILKGVGFNVVAEVAADALGFPISHNTIIGLSKEIEGAYEHFAMRHKAPEPETDIGVDVLENVNLLNAAMKETRKALSDELLEANAARGVQLAMLAAIVRIIEDLGTLASFELRKARDKTLLPTLEASRKKSEEVQRAAGQIK